MTHFVNHKWSTGLFGLFLLVLVAGCGERLSSHGHFIDEYDLQDIIIGETTKNDILFSLGKPSFEGAFDSNKLYYVSQNMVQPAGGRKQTTSREIFAFIFDDDSMLYDIVVTDKETGLEIAKLRSKNTNTWRRFWRD